MANNNKKESEDDTHIAIFKGKSIRRKIIGDKWHFSIIDTIGVLTDSTIPKRYWSDLKIKLKEEGFELYDKIVQLKLKSGDGKEYETDCADTEGIFRIIQSIPSKKVEPFKRWLAKVGYERIQEIENPEVGKPMMYDRKGTREVYVKPFRLSYAYIKHENKIIFLDLYHKDGQ